MRVMCDRSDTDWDVFDRDAGHVEFRGGVGERCICRGATQGERHRCLMAPPSATFVILRS